jgi:hypothetical protein
MKCDHCYSSSWLQNCQIVCSNISFNAPISSFTSIRNAWKTWAKYLFGFPFTSFYGLFKLVMVFSGVIPSLHRDRSRQCFCIGYFAILFKYLMQLLFGIFIQDIGCCCCLPLIHPHIQCSIKPVEKPRAASSNW